MVRGYTTIEQSNKLAEILPPETADMYWNYDVQKHEHYPMVMDDQFDDTCTHAWTLVSLLEVLPSATLDSSDDHYYRLRCNERFTEWHDNPIDACVAMIEKLNELNLL